jgi:hypothetical protein
MIRPDSSNINAKTSPPVKREIKRISLSKIITPGEFSELLNEEPPELIVAGCEGGETDSTRRPEIKTRIKTSTEHNKLARIR